ncbi:MAG: hypothetical protein CVV06_18025 [Gammaproteobacteria bacterium HGW-Gammaproteobacteria-10]|nr:MAG: hypothetical protein CVV06_18025 [Gammaproteobacteria bacterium HGW-Gammaproteobacteria-10]
MTMLFCSVARRENRRIASYVTVFATQLPDKRARKKAENVTARSIEYSELLIYQIVGRVNHTTERTL